MIYQQGQINSNTRDNHISVSQKIEFPTVYSGQSKLASENVTKAQGQFDVQALILINKVKSVYYKLVYLDEKRP